MLIAHISDVHLPMTRPRRWELLSKSFLSFLSWHHKRKRVHLPEVTSALLEDMRAHSPDHICVTGDLANASFRSELEQARAWLEDLAPAEKISFVPGNHETIVKRAEKKKPFYFSKWMRSDDKVKKAPYIQRKGGIAFIGLDSAVATPPTFASGRLGEAQLARLAKLLKKAADEGLFRVVMIHHPPLPKMAKYRSALRDAETLQTVLQERGAELVLHGHNHRPMHKTLETTDGEVNIFGAGSASTFHVAGKWSAHYNLFEVKKGKFEVTQRIYDPESKKFVAYNPQ